MDYGEIENLLDQIEELSERCSSEEFTFYERSLREFEEKGELGARIVRRLYEMLDSLETRSGLHVGGDDDFDDAW